MASRRSWLFLCCALGCSSASYDSGATALLQVEQARFMVGALPGGDAASGPEVVDTYSRTSWVTPGQRGKTLIGTLGTGATAVALALEGDRGHWILPASTPSTDAPDHPTFSALLGFSRLLTGTEVHVLVRAVDLSGHGGPTTVVPFGIAPDETFLAPLAVALSWDTQSDLDLHVVDPSGEEIYASNIVSARPEAGAGVSSGYLDFDSNADCVIDGRRLETVSWSQPPPGHFVVRVDSFSLCAATVAHWRVRVYRAGALWMEGQGMATPTQDRLSKGRGSGIQALVFDWPGAG